MTSSSTTFGKRLQSFLYFLKHWIKGNWQPLLLLFGIYLPLAIFIVLAIQIWRLEGGLGWDIAILMAIHQTAHPWLDGLAAIWTKLGTKWGVFPATAVIAMALLYRRRWRWLTYWLIALLGCGSINLLAKTWLHRVRPSLWAYPPLADFSFPSGHAMASMGFVMALLVLTWHSRWRIWVLLLGSLFVVSIAWTRLYLGVHYPSDIVAGWMMAIAWTMGTSLAVKPFAATPIASAPIPPTPIPPATSTSLTQTPPRSWDSGEP